MGLSRVLFDEVDAAAEVVPAVVADAGIMHDPHLTEPLSDDDPMAVHAIQVDGIRGVAFMT